MTDVKKFNITLMAFIWEQNTPKKLQNEQRYSHNHE